MSFYKSESILFVIFLILNFKTSYFISRILILILINQDKSLQILS